MGQRKTGQRHEDQLSGAGGQPSHRFSERLQQSIIDKGPTLSSSHEPSDTQTDIWTQREHKHVHKIILMLKRSLVGKEPVLDPPDQCEKDGRGGTCFYNLRTEEVDTNDSLGLTGHPAWSSR